MGNPAILGTAVKHGSTSHFLDRPPSVRCMTTTRNDTWRFSELVSTSFPGAHAPVQIDIAVRGPFHLLRPVFPAVSPKDETFPSGFGPRGRLPRRSRPPRCRIVRGGHFLRRFRHPSAGCRSPRRRTRPAPPRQTAKDLRGASSRPRDGSDKHRIGSLDMGSFGRIHPHSDSSTVPKIRRGLARTHWVGGETLAREEDGLAMVAATAACWG